MLEVPKEITKEIIFSRYPWSKPINLELADDEQEFFCDPTPWTFNPPQLKMIYVMLGEVEECYVKRDLPVQVKIFEIKEVMGHIFVEMICGNSEVEQIFEKFRNINLSY